MSRKRPGLGRRHFCEKLERRVFLSLVSWTGGGDGVNWTDPANWSSNPSLPGSSDDVTIGVPANPTIQLSSAQSIHSLSSGELLSLNLGATLAVATTAQFSANVTLLGGTISNCTLSTSGGAQILVVAGGFSAVTLASDMTIGNAGAGTLTILNGLTFSGGAKITLDGTSNSTLRILSGTQTIGGTGEIVLGSAGPNSLISLTGAPTVTVSPGVTIRGRGDINQPSGTATLINQGTISANLSGQTLNIVVNALTNSGTAQPANGGTLSANIPGSITFAGGTAQFNGSFSTGSISISSGTTDFSNAGPVTIANATLSGGTLAGTADVNITNSLTWSGGTMSGSGKTIIASGATQNIGTVQTKTLDRRMENNGTTEWSDGRLVLNAGAFTNNGAFTINSNTLLQCSDNVANAANVFNNVGSFTKMGTGEARFTTGINGIPFNNSGTVNVQAGTLTLDAGGTETGPFSISTTATLNLSTKPFTFSVAASITCAAGAGGILFGTQATLDGAVSMADATATFTGGPVVFNSSFSTTGMLSVSGNAQATIGNTFAANSLSMTGGTLTLNAAQNIPSLSISGGTLGGTGDFTSPSTFAWSGGTLSGSGKITIASGATLDISSVQTKQLNRPMDNNGTTNWTAGNLLLNAGPLNNNGSFNISSTLTFQCSDNIANPANVFNNTGLFTKQGTGELKFTSGQNGIPFNNSGTVNVQAGKLSLESGVQQLTGATLTGGTWLVGTTGTLNFSSGSNITTNQANVTLDGVGSTFAKIANLATNSGTLTLANGRAFDFTPAGNTFTNTGTFTASGATQLTIPSAITFNTSGTVSGNADIQFAGTANWSGGAMNGPGAAIIPVNAIMNITGIGLRATTRALQIAGLVDLELGGDVLLRVTQITTNGPGRMNTNNNAVIVDSTGSRTPTLAAIQALINSARNGGLWNGPGITSNTARDNPQHNTTLGAMDAADFKAIYGPGALFHGQPVSNNAVLVMYTYYGDSNFNGKVDGADYARIDSIFNQQSTQGNIGGWFNGDLDGNGKIDGADYALIDAAFNNQGPPLAGTGRIVGKTIGGKLRSL